jgi:hypothetical protein
MAFYEGMYTGSTREAPIYSRLNKSVLPWQLKIFDAGLNRRAWLEKGTLFICAGGLILRPLAGLLIIIIFWTSRPGALMQGQRGNLYKIASALPQRDEYTFNIIEES